jgi:hypothetical protein
MDRIPYSNDSITSCSRGSRPASLKNWTSRNSRASWITGLVLAPDTSVTTPPLAITKSKTFQPS